jgi:hypothetical protein
MGKAVDRTSAPKNGFARQPYPKNGFKGSAPSKPAPVPGAQADKPEPEILFQKYFKSVGPRTYAAQLKRATNGNHFLVLTEGKRDEKTGDIRKTKLFVWSEDFVAFFRMLHETAKHIRENPLPQEIRQKRERYWAKQAAEKSSAPPQSAMTNSPKPARR